MSRTLGKLGFPLLAALGLVQSAGCFSESATEGLFCSADDQCGRGQVCDSVSTRCVLEEEESATTGDSETTTGSTTGSSEACNTPDELRCDPNGVDVQSCQNGIWVNVSCDGVCQDNYAPPSRQVGACIDNNGAVSCECADGLGGECMAGDPRTCTDQGLLEFCSTGQAFRLTCETDCADEGYPAGGVGPCVDEPGQGAPDCVCADGTGGSCSLSEQFVEECLNATFLRKCVDQTWYETDCNAECARTTNGASTTGSCVDNGGIFSCACD